MKEIIKIENLNKTYDTGAIQVHALRGINLTIHEGEYVAIMGQSGSGKSTLMNILGCMDRQFSGTYELDGISIAQQSENQLSAIRNQKIGFVFQAFQLIPRTSALKNVEIPMIYAGMKADARKAKAAALLEKVGLGQRIHHMPNELSGGQKKRVFLARALAQQSKIILLDEPFTGVDVKTENAIVELLRQLRAEGHLILVSTHNLGSVPDFCDQVVMINRTVITAGKTEDTFNQHNLEKVFGGVLRHIKLLGEDLHNDEDKRAVTVLTDDERPVVFYGETKNDPPATAVKSCRLPPSDKE